MRHCQLRKCLCLGLVSPFLRFPAPGQWYVLHAELLYRSDKRDTIRGGHLPHRLQKVAEDVNLGATVVAKIHA